MKSIYIVLTNTGTFLNRAIKTVTNAPYNHASIALDVGWICERGFCERNR